MAFNINNFRAEVSKNFFARTSDFEVEINQLPGGIQLNSNIRIQEALTPIELAAASLNTSQSLPATTQRPISNIENSLTFRIDTVVMPSRGIQRIEYRDYGVPYLFGGIANYLEVQMTVMVSPNLQEREFFMQWQDLITGNHRTGTTKFDVGYYKDYVCEQGFNIYQLDDRGNRTHKITLIDSYPSFIGPLNANWGQTDVQRMDVTMVFRYFQEEILTVVEPISTPATLNRR